MTQDAKAAERPKSITRRGAARREAMIAAATEVFLAHGYDGASLDMVIERAGGSRGTLYDHFGGKEGLFTAVVAGLLDGIVDAFSAADADDAPPEEALVSIGVGFVSALLEPRALAVFRLILGETPRFPRLGARFFEEGPERAYARMAEVLATLDRDGRFALDDPRRDARMLVEMMKGELLLKALLAPDAPPGEDEIEAQVRAAVETFLLGRAAPTAPLRSAPPAGTTAQR